MQKIIYLGVLLLIVSGCSAFKHRKASSISDENNGKSSDYLIDLNNRNLTRYNFYIKSVDIEYNEGSNKNAISGSIKYEKPDKYLIALRSRTGIEFARIFINKDSVYINDRLKRKVYGGRLEHIQRKCGFPAEILPMFLGDFVGKCALGDLDKMGVADKFVSCNISGIKIRYEIDQFIEKAVNVISGDGDNTDFGSMRYSKFLTINNTTYPSRISYINEVMKVSAELKIRKVEIPWYGTIDFNIGDRSKILKLL